VGQVKGVGLRLGIEVMDMTPQESVSVAAFALSWPRRNEFRGGKKMRDLN
jgi:hypothetical protein